jgi:hypothetical protein
VGVKKTPRPIIIHQIPSNKLAKLTDIADFFDYDEARVISLSGPSFGTGTKLLLLLSRPMVGHIRGFYERVLGVFPTSGAHDTLRPPCSSRKHRHLNATLLGTSLCDLVPRICVPHDPGGGIVAQHTRKPHLRFCRSITYDHDTRVLRVPHPYPSTVVKRYPRRATGRIEERIEERPIRYSIGTIEHRFSLTVRARHRSRVEMVATDYDWGTHLSRTNHLIEGDPHPRSILYSEPADAGRQPLETDSLSGHVEPSMEVIVVRQELSHLGISTINILWVA